MESRFAELQTSAAAMSYALVASLFGIFAPYLSRCSVADLTDALPGGGAAILQEREAEPGLGHCQINRVTLIPTAGYRDA